MADFTGKDAVYQWVYSGGTVPLNSDYRSYSYTPSVDLAETTAGSDTHKTYIATVKDGRISITMLAQAGGTALRTALAEGTSGTLVESIEGTASTKPKRSYPAISMGAVINEPYNEVVEVSVEFQQNGAPVDANW